jgi:hypothetical protein
MQHLNGPMTTPVFVKTSPVLEIPAEEPVAYVVARSGLFLHRRHAFFTSCVKARSGPGDLHEQANTLRLHHPRIARATFERVIGFFSRIAERHGSEAAVLLLWDEESSEIVVHVPVQRASVSVSWSGRRSPLEVAYDVPADMPARYRLIGDVHSHVNEAAYASATDQRDEEHRPGLHLVVGRIGWEPPELHAEFVVDGCRFLVDPKAVIEGYEARREDEVPEEWIERVEVDVLEPRWGSNPAYRAETSSYRPRTLGDEIAPDGWSRGGRR